MENTIEISMLDSIGNDHIKSLVEDYGELALETVFSNEFVEKIPVVGTIMNLGTLGATIKDRIFTQKVLKFLFEVKDIGYKEKKDFIDSVNHNTKYRTKVGSHLLLILDKIDDLEKPTLIGKLFKHALNKNIDYDTFLRLASIVSRTFTPDLLELNKVKNQELVSNISLENLQNQGLLSIELKKHQEKIGTPGINKNPKQVIEYKLNFLSELLIKYAIN